MLKDILENIIEDVNRAERHPVELFKECIDEKLQNSYNYEVNNVIRTCQFILSKNPVFMLKHMSKVVEEMGENNYE